MDKETTYSLLEEGDKFTFWPIEDANFKKDGLTVLMKAKEIKQGYTNNENAFDVKTGRPAHVAEEQFVIKLSL